MSKTRPKQPELDEPAYRIIFESALEGIIAVNKQGQIVFANSQAEKMFGYAGGELVGKPHDILVPTGSRKPHHDQLAHYVSKPVPRLMGSGLELVGERKDGSDFPVDINLIPLRTKQPDRHAGKHQQRTDPPDDAENRVKHADSPAPAFAVDRLRGQE